MRIDALPIPEQWIENLAGESTGAATSPVVALALSERALMTARTSGEITASTTGVGGEQEHVGASPFPVGELAMGATSYLVRSQAGDAVALLQPPEARAKPEELLRIESRVRGVPLAVAGFAQAEGQEILLASGDSRRLELYDPSTGHVLAERPAPRRRALVYRRFVPAGDGNSVIALGYYDGEAKDSLVRLELSRLLADDDYLDEVLYRPDLTDYAYRLAAGPALPGTVVVYRDAEDDEDDEEDSPNRSDVHGLNGFYFRELAHSTPRGGRLPLVLESLRTGDPVFATSSYIAVGVEGGLCVVGRARHEVMRQPASVLAFHPPSRRVAAWADGRLSVITIPE